MVFPYKVLSDTLGFKTRKKIFKNNKIVYSYLTFHFVPY